MSKLYANGQVITIDADQIEMGDINLSDIKEEVSKCHFDLYNRNRFALTLGKVIIANAIGSKATVGTNNNFASSDFIPVSIGDVYHIYGDGGNAQSRLWTVLDSTNTVIAIAESDASYSKKNPYVLEITQSNASKVTVCGRSSSLCGIVKLGKDGIVEDILDTIRPFEKNSNYPSILLDGASFAYTDNTWFSKLCRRLNTTGFNRAVNGSSIHTMAQKMHDGTEYSPQELEEFDVLLIMHVHNQDVANTTGIQENIDDYTFPASSNMSYAQAFDYVLKKYAIDCYSLKDNPDSKYYGYPMGKPFVVVMCTNWHDGRTIYNSSIRRLQEKWGFYLVELDKNIGFSRNQPNPTTGEQMSRMYAQDTTTIDGIVYGWHPARSGKAADYIQTMIANCCYEVISKLPNPFNLFNSNA